MRLPSDRYALSNINLNFTQLRDCIIERRKVIREHRDAIVDHRCHFDDYLVWDMLHGHPDFRSALPPYHEMMKMCADFYKHRNSIIPDIIIPTAALFRPLNWNGDLNQMGEKELFEELLKIQEAIYDHNTIGDRSRTADDDRTLYLVLPEKMPADFRLPSREDFLGCGKAPTAGCPSFWHSHSNNGCKGVGHNLHQWGPCEAAE